MTGKEKEYTIKCSKNYSPRTDRNRAADFGAE